uniref:Uncharacterized protein n=1 Tax=Oryza rufipogon TaxID=4529 RepID=A0A0E0QBD2_ORYRU
MASPRLAFASAPSPASELDPPTSSCVPAGSGSCGCGLWLPRGASGGHGGSGGGRELWFGEMEWERGEWRGSGGWRRIEAGKVERGVNAKVATSALSMMPTSAFIGASVSMTLPMSPFIFVT